MTVAADVEKTMARYAEAKAALWGKPKKTNIFVEERRAIEEYRKAQKQRWKEEERKKKEKERPQSTKRKPNFFNILLETGTYGRFSVDNTISYWCFDTREPVAITRLTSMNEIALRVLADYPGIGMENIRGYVKNRDAIAARKIIVAEIHKQIPGVSFPQIGRFINRDHTSVMSILGLKKRTRKGKRDG